MEAKRLKHLMASMWKIFLKIGIIGTSQHMTSPLIFNDINQKKKIRLFRFNVYSFPFFPPPHFLLLT